MRPELALNHCPRNPKPFRGGRLGFVSATYFHRLQLGGMEANHIFAAASAKGKSQASKQTNGFKVGPPFFSGGTSQHGFGFAFCFPLPNKWRPSK